MSKNLDVVFRDIQIHTQTSTLDLNTKMVTLKSTEGIKSLHASVAK